MVRQQGQVEALKPKEFSYDYKMSDVILAFAELLLRYSQDDKDFENILAFAVLCWNISFLPVV